MKLVKYSIILVLVCCLFQTAFGEKRVKPRAMKELTDPASPSYVPIPYPKNKEEITIDLKYAIKKVFASGNKRAYLGGKTPEIRTTMLKLLDENSGYNVGETVKVKNRNNRFAHDYGWLIMVRDENGENVARVSMSAAGHLGQMMGTRHGATVYKDFPPSARRGPQYLKSKDEVVAILADALGHAFTESKIKRMDRVAYQSPLSGLVAPMWEIKLHNGSMYYYSVKMDTVYELAERKPWKKNKKGYRDSVRSLIPDTNDFLSDRISDELLVLKKLKKEK